MAQLAKDDSVPCCAAALAMIVFQVFENVGMRCALALVTASRCSWFRRRLVVAHPLRRIGIVSSVQYAIASADGRRPSRIGGSPSALLGALPAELRLCRAGPGSARVAPPHDRAVE